MEPKQGGVEKKAEVELDGGRMCRQGEACSQQESKDLSFDSSRFRPAGNKVSSIRSLEIGVLTHRIFPKKKGGGEKKHDWLHSCLTVSVAVPSGPIRHSVGVCAFNMSLVGMYPLQCAESHDRISATKMYCNRRHNSTAGRSDSSPARCLPWSPT